MRSIRREHREFVFQRLEGWWTDAVIKHLTGARPEGIFGYEVSDKLSSFAEEYKADNLPITFRGKLPADEIDTDSDPCLFVAQLREIGISSNRIRSAILDYYRAFEQRSAWARENLLVLGEVEEYEDRLTDEWGRYKDVAFEKLTDDSAEDALREAASEANSCEAAIEVAADNDNLDATEIEDIRMEDLGQEGQNMINEVSIERARRDEYIRGAITHFQSRRVGESNATLRNLRVALYFLSCFCVAASGESDAEQIQPSDLAPSAVMRFAGSTVRNFWMSSFAPGEMGSHQGEGKSYLAWRIVSKRACACVGRKEGGEVGE